MKGAFIVFVPLHRDAQSWVGATVLTKGDDSFTPLAIIEECKAEEIVDGDVTAHWRPDEDFSAVLPCDHLTAIGSKLKVDVEPMFFGLTVMTSAFILCKSHEGELFPFHPLDLRAVAAVFQGKQELWRNRIRQAEPDANFKSLGEMIGALNNE